MAIWNVIEIFRDKSLLSRVRAELTAAEYRGITSSEDIDKLSSLPLLQSINTELLRLRIEVQTVFSSDREDIHINQWKFPRNTLLIVPAGPAHRDLDVWNTKNGEHPVDQFWADRFLVHPEDPQSGPRNNHIAHERSSVKTARMSTNAVKAKFVSSGLANSLVPWGIGERTCPGRAIARREILAFCAIVVDQFDIEILSSDKPIVLDPAFYGIGTQRPVGRIPFKVRKRQIKRENP